MFAQLTDFVFCRKIMAKQILYFAFHSLFMMEKENPREIVPGVQLDPLSDLKPYGLIPSYERGNIACLPKNGNSRKTSKE